MHFFARRHSQDEGFILTTSCMSSNEFEYVTREQLEPGETLLLKIVSGPHVIDVKGIVQTVSQNNLDRRGTPPRISFLELSEHERRIIEGLIRRHRTCIA